MVALGTLGLQKTIGAPFNCSGVGVHHGGEALLTVRPAAVNHGIKFVRQDIAEEDNIIPALWSNVIDTTFCVRLANAHNVTIGTIEHLMAAFRGCGVANALVEINGPEVPIMDGSAQNFVDKICQVGTIIQLAPITYTVVLKAVEVTQGANYAKLTPSHRTSYQVHFDGHGKLESQFFSYYPHRDNFTNNLAAARTFGFLEDAQRLWSLGLAKGASLENTVVLQKEGEVLNQEGLRFANELARHKVLDAIGDLSLADGQIIGEYQALNAGHKLNNLLLKALYNDSSAWCHHSITRESDLLMFAELPRVKAI